MAFCTTTWCIAGMLAGSAHTSMVPPSTEEVQGTLGIGPCFQLGRTAEVIGKNYPLEAGVITQHRVHHGR